MLTGPVGSDDPMPSAGALSDPFERMRLISQSQPIASLQPKMPVPLFSQNVDQNAGPDIPVSQMDYLATPDYITPADQFQLDYEPANKAAKNQRSPAQLSPNRAKRARGIDELPGFTASQGGTHPISQGNIIAGRHHLNGLPTGAPVFKRVPRRCKSPPTYRSVFKDSENEQEQFAEWKIDRPAPQGFSRFKDEFKLLGMLGAGSFSKVEHARHRLDGCEYAVKRSHHSVGSSEDQFVQYLQEVQLMAHLPPHQNVIRYYGSWLEPDDGGKSRLYTQLEKCGENLKTYSALTQPMSEATVLNILKQMCQALAHLHANGIAHMDVKPENIFVNSPENDDDDGSKTIYKLGDFGLAVRMHCKETTVFEGDKRFLPKELLNGDHSRLDKADMFSLGCTIYELLSQNDVPAEGPSYQALREGKLPLLPTVTRSLYNMVKALMSPKPEDRPSAERVLRSNLFNKGKPMSQATTSAVEERQQPAAAAPSKQFGGLVLQKRAAV